MSDPEKEEKTTTKPEDAENSGKDGKDKKGEQETAAPKDEAGASSEGEDKSFGERAGEFVGNNKFGLGGLILGGLLAMAMGMGPLGILLMGLLAGGLLNAFADNENSLAGNVMGGGEDKNRNEGTTVTPEQTLGKVNTLDANKTPMEHQDFAVKADGTLVAQGNPASFTNESAKEADMMVSGNFVGEGENRQFHISHVALKQKDGTFLRGEKGAILMTGVEDANIMLPVGKDGNIDLGNEAAKAGLGQAKTIVQKAMGAAEGATEGTGRMPSQDTARGEDKSPSHGGGKDEAPAAGVSAG